MEEKHFEYLMSLVREKPEKQQTMHALYVELNKLNGMYWIAFSATILNRMHGTDISEILHAFRLKLTPTPRVTVPELGGPLRALSLVQLCILLDLDIPKEIGVEAAEFLNLNFSKEKKTVFWFDIRALYCCLLILRLTDSLDCLDEKSSLNIFEYIKASQSVLGGFGAGPRSEAHAGYTFCAVACLSMLDLEIPRLSRLSHWLEGRLSQFNGRPGKPADSCYVWWACASLCMIKTSVETHREKIDTFLNYNCACKESGGYSKYPSIPIDEDSVHGRQDPDLLHTFLALASIALFRGLIDPVSVLPFAS